MKNEEIVRALRCVSTAGGENACEHCPYWKEEEVPEEERPIYGADTMHSCDVDRVGLDGADLIERLTARCARYAEEIAVAISLMVSPYCSISSSRSSTWMYSRVPPRISTAASPEILSISGTTVFSI